MARRARGTSRWNSELCRSGECGHAHHPKLDDEQKKILRRARPTPGWHNGARVRT